MSSAPSLTVNDLHLEDLLKNVGTRVLRELFKRRYERSTGKPWIDRDRDCRKFLISQTARVKGLKWQNIQKLRIDSASLNWMDLSQLGTLLLKFQWTSIVTTPVLTEDEKSAIECENIYVEALADVRNYHAHSPGPSNDAGISEKLKLHWIVARTVLLELGGEELAREIDEIRLQFDKKEQGFNPMLLGHPYLPPIINIINTLHPNYPIRFPWHPRNPSYKTKHVNGSNFSQAGPSSQDFHTHTPNNNQSKHVPFNSKPRFQTPTVHRPPRPIATKVFQGKASPSFSPRLVQPQHPPPIATYTYASQYPNSTYESLPGTSQNRSYNSYNRDEVAPPTTSRHPSTHYEKQNVNAGASTSFKSSPRPSNDHAPRTSRYNNSSPSPRPVSVPSHSSNNTPGARQNSVPRFSASGSIPRAAAQSIPRNLQQNSSTPPPRTRSTPQKSTSENHYQNFKKR